MRAYSLTHVSDPELRRGLSSLVAQDRVTTARLLAHLAEFDARRLYLPAAHPSMYSYCVQELRLSEDAAYKRIQAARTCHRFPVLFEGLADGRLHLSAVGLLAPFMTPENAADLLAAATHKTKAEIEESLAQRFPRSESLALVTNLPASPRSQDAQLAPGQVAPPEQAPPGAAACQLAPGQVGARSRVAPVAPERFLLQVSIAGSTRDKLRHAQDLLGHQVPSGDLAQVLDRALEALIERLERRKCAATSRPRARRSTTNPRHIPAHVKRAVWERDGGQCTFVSDSGRRCAARARLELDHVEPVARGGEASVDGIRLRCRAHNQYAAECAFGADFMRHKREAARADAAVRRQVAAAQVTTDAREREAADEVIEPLLTLGFRAGEARQAAALCEGMPDAPLEQRVRRALTYFKPRPRAHGSPSIGTG